MRRPRAGPVTATSFALPACAQERMGCAVANIICAWSPRPGHSPLFDESPTRDRAASGIVDSFASTYTNS
jgi:hypothetical protein